MTFISSFFILAREDGLGDKVDGDLPGVKELLVEGLFGANGSLDVVCGELDPDVAIAALLDVYLVDFAEFRAHQLDLVLDVQEEGRVFAQVDVLRFEHVVEQEAVGRLSHNISAVLLVRRVLCISSLRLVVATFLSHLLPLLAHQFLHKHGSRLS